MSKVERNAPCPCGSGKKYKKCCGKGERSSPFGLFSGGGASSNARSLLGRISVGEKNITSSAPPQFPEAKAEKTPAESFEKANKTDKS